MRRGDHTAPVRVLLNSASECWSGNAPSLSRDEHRHQNVNSVSLGGGGEKLHRSFTRIETRFLLLKPDDPLPGPEQAKPSLTSGQVLGTFIASERRSPTATPAGLEREEVSAELIAMI